jgi:hypothetical protein
MVNGHGHAGAPRIGHTDVDRRTVDQAQIRMTNVVRLAVRQANAKRFEWALVQMLANVFRSDHETLPSFAILATPCAAVFSVQGFKPNDVHIRTLIYSDDRPA